MDNIYDHSTLFEYCAVYPLLSIRLFPEGMVVDDDVCSGIDYHLQGTENDNAPLALAAIYDLYNGI